MEFLSSLQLFVCVCVCVRACVRVCVKEQSSDLQPIITSSVTIKSTIDVSLSFHKEKKRKEKKKKTDFIRLCIILHWKLHV